MTPVALDHCHCGWHMATSTQHVVPEGPRGASCVFRSPLCSHRLCRLPALPPGSSAPRCRDVVLSLKFTSPLVPFCSTSLPWMQKHPPTPPALPALWSSLVCQHMSVIEAVGWTQRFPLGLPHLSVCPVGAIFLPPAPSLGKQLPRVTAAKIMGIPRALQTPPWAQASCWLRH